MALPGCTLIGAGVGAGIESLTPGPYEQRPPAQFARLERDLLVDYLPELPAGVAAQRCQSQVNALAALGTERRKLLSASSTEAILGFVAAGLGYSLVPWPDVRGPQFRGVIAIRQKGHGTEFPILAAWRNAPSLTR